jgi:hypothetical protein
MTAHTYSILGPRLQRVFGVSWRRWLWAKVIEFHVGKFGVVDPELSHRHHDAVEFPDGTRVLVTQLMQGQRVTVLQLPVTSHNLKPTSHERAQVAAHEAKFTFDLDRQRR